MNYSLAAVLLVGLVVPSLTFAKVKSFSPLGAQESINQVRIEFPSAQVGFGDLNAKAPATSTCFETFKGQGRWLSTQEWVFDFNAFLPKGIDCEVKVSTESFKFSTGEPDINIVASYSDQVTSDQHFILEFPQGISAKKLQEASYVVIAGLGDRIPVEIFSKKETKEFFKKLKRNDQAQEGYVKLFAKAQRPLPLGVKGTFVVPKGLEYSKGKALQKDSVYEFQVQGAFAVEMTCDHHSDYQTNCMPLGSISLNFNRDIDSEYAREIYLESPKGLKIFSTQKKSIDSKNKISNLVFEGPFEPLESYKVIVPSKIKSTEGDVLEKISLVVKTAEMPPLLKFDSGFGIYEADGNVAIPLNVRNVELALPTSVYGVKERLDVSKLPQMFKYIGSNGSQYNIPEDEELKKWGVSSEELQIERKKADKAIEVVGIPVDKKGFYLIKVKSSKLNSYYSAKNENSESTPLYSLSKKDATEWTMALVTNLAAHVKESREEFVVWVTELKTATPVLGADVKIFDDNGKLYAAARTDKQGFAIIKKSSLNPDLQKNVSGNGSGIFVVAQTADDFTLTSNYWNRGIEPWRFGSSSYSESSGSIIHPILDRTLLKENEVLSGKIISRYFNDKGLLIFEKTEYPKTLVMNHISGLQKFEIPLVWNKQNGSSVFSWKIPAGVKNGQWELVVNNNVISTVVVENYRLPMIDLKISSEQAHYVGARSIPMNVYGQYFSGGVTSDLKFKFRWSLETDYSNVGEQYSDYNFFNTLQDSEESYGDGYNEESVDESSKASVVEGKLDNNGKWSKKIDIKTKGARPYRLNSEVEYKDPNGEIKIAKKYIKIWPEDTLIGVKYGSYKRVGNKYQFDVDVVAVDPDGKPLANKDIELKLVKSFSYTHKKRLIGGFYGSDYFYEHKTLGSICSGKTNHLGVYTCKAETAETGELYLQAFAKASSGNVVSSAAYLWLPSAQDFYLGDYSNSDRIDLIPNKKSYKIGETAEFKLVMPFSEAQVWVTVERDGIIHRELRTLKANDPVIKLVIKPEYMPNVFVSALAIRGRVSEFKKDQTVDLGRPSVKFALANIKVDSDQNLLMVDVSTPKKDYKARDEVKVKVKVTDYLNRPAPNAEVLLVGVDEGLLALKGNNTWDLSSHLLKAWGLGVSTATNMLQLEGKRHFGLKAVPVGGDGAGGVLTRELFDSLLYWNPNLKVDKNGEVEVGIKLNDSTTSFRFVAVVLNGAAQFGSGKASVRSTQDYIVMPGLANVSRVGDKFQAGFTIRNTTKVAGKVLLTLTTDLKDQKLAPYEMSLKAQEAKDVSWPIKVPSGISSITYLLEAKNEKGHLVDRVKKTQQVVPFAVPRIYQSSFAQLSEMKKTEVVQPANLGEPTSEVIVDVMAQLGVSKEGLKTFWDSYGYSCFEQKFSRAVTLADGKEWVKLSSSLSLYLDDNGLLKYFPKMDRGDVSLTAYVLTMTKYMNWSISLENQERMTMALSNFVEGRLSSAGARPDDMLLKISAIEALALQGVTNSAWIPNLKINLDILPMYSLLQLAEIGKQKGNLLGAGIQKGILNNKIRASFYYTGTKVFLKNKDRENLFWMLRDENTTLLKFMQVFMADPEYSQDIPKVFRAVIDRQKNNSFPLTMNNAWLSLVNEGFQKKHKTPVAGQFVGKLGTEIKTHNWQNQKMGTLNFSLNKRSDNLILEQKGSGNPWVMISAKGLLVQTKDEFNGFTMKRTLVPLSQKVKGQWSVGDRVSVEIEYSTKFQSNWVVVSEPTPTGASVIDVDSSAIHEYKPEVSNFYFPWVYSGEKIKYTLLLSQKGEYKLPGTIVEVMYNPDIYARLADTVLVVK